MFVLAHLSDPHLGPLPTPRLTELAGKRAAGFFNWRRKRHRIHRAEVLARVTADLKTQAVDHIAVTGDLVNISLAGEYAPARAWLASLGSPRDVTLVPGNHDAYVRAAAHYPQLHWGEYMRGDDTPETAFPFVRRRGPLALIGLSTAVPTAAFLATGRLGREQIEKFAEALERCGREAFFRVVMIHHPPISKPARHLKRLAVGVSCGAGAARRARLRRLQSLSDRRCQRRLALRSHLAQPCAGWKWHRRDEAHGAYGLESIAAAAVGSINSPAMRYTQRPPSTSSTLPVRNEASLETRNSVALATSSIVAKRPSGTVALNCARSSGESPPMKVGNSGVSAITGAIAQTRMPSAASSAAIDFDRRFTAPLEALYQVSPGRGLIPAVEPILMITPDFCLRMNGTTACANRKIDLTFTAMSRSNSASSASSMGRRTWLMPALLTRMSIPPKASTVAFTAALTSARCETSQRTAIALLLIDVAAARAASPSMSMTATRAPSRAKVAAIPLPKPDAAPVTSATLLSRRMLTSSFGLQFHRSMANLLLLSKRSSLT